MSAAKTITRGGFIIFEGCDRSGKSTQSKQIYKFLCDSGIKAQLINFPARDTPSGKLINSYLKNETEFSDETIHLLFSANRWEIMDEMKKKLESGVTLLVDRYSFSGVVFSTAKGLNYEWCKGPEKGVIRPDLVIYLTSNLEVLASRGDFGSERYEKVEFQKKVQKVFKQIHQEEKDYWLEINADQKIDEIHNQLKIEILNCLERVKQKPLLNLWCE